jgi:three-Cys-motif partner protein
MARRKSSQEILDALEEAPDGMPTRKIGVWSLEKLAILLLYFQAFTNATSKAAGGIYVDGLAGPGLCDVRGARARPKTVLGSPLIALRTQPSFKYCHFIEYHRGTADTLRRRIEPYDQRAAVHRGNVNELLPALMRDTIHPKAPCFCLLDPEGTELKWQTVRDTALVPRDRKPELLILFPSSWLMRLLPRKGLVDPDHERIPES